MWPFILIRSVSLHKNIQASKAEALLIVQDPEEMLRLNSLATSVVQNDNDPAWYTITDKLSMPGGLFESTMTFRCRWEIVEGGADAEVYAGADIYVKNEMRVLDAEEGGVEYREVVVVKVRRQLRVRVHCANWSANVRVCSFWCHTLYPP
jgi:hypothetical protein